MQSKKKISTTSIISDNCKLFLMHLHYKSIWIYADIVKKPTLLRAFLNLFTHKRESELVREREQGQRARDNMLSAADTQLAASLKIKSFNSSKPA